MNGNQYERKYDPAEIAAIAWAAHDAGKSPAQAVALQVRIDPRSASTLMSRLRKEGVVLPYQRTDMIDLNPEEPPVLERLEYELATREPWMERSACRGLDPNLFFPERGQPTETAKGVCGECPVREDCLDYSIRTRQVWGVWGGTSERERRGLRREARTVRVA
jgi:WhiB family transcriptional regulator, redox-sensing transcriptional regulator